MRTSLYDAQLFRGAKFRDELGWEVPSSFNDPDGEYRAVRTDAGIVDRSHRGLLLVEGSEAREFLHGCATNDIKGMPEGKGCYSAFINVKGKMQGDARVLNLGEKLLLDVEPNLSKPLLEHLDKYTIGTDAELSDVSDELGMIGVYGLNSPEVLARFLGEDPGPLEDLETIECAFDGAPLWIAGNPLTGESGFDLIAPRARLEALYNALMDAGQGMRPIGTLALEMLRVEAGVPRFWKDMTEDTIPLEAGLDHAISFTKGCYLGQEVIARVTHQGHVNRKLTGLLLQAGPLPESGRKLTSGGKDAGWITTAVDSPALGRPVALGYVRREFLEAGTRLGVDGGGEAVVAELPFYRK